MGDTIADHASGQSTPCVLNGFEAIILDSHPPQSLQPTDGSLYNPTHCPQTTSMFGTTTSNDRLNPQPRQQTASVVAVEASIGKDRVGMFLGPTGLSRNLRESPVRWE